MFDDEELKRQAEEAERLFREELEKVHVIKFKDGTEIECTLNGNVYIYKGEISDNLIKFDNTLKMWIDNVEYENQVCQKFKNIDDDTTTHLVFNPADRLYLMNLDLLSQIDYVAMMADVEV